MPPNQLDKARALAPTGAEVLGKPNEEMRKAVVLARSRKGPVTALEPGLGNSSEISLLHYETVWSPDLYRAVAA